MHVWDIKEGDRHRFRCLLKQSETDVQSTSNRKLPNFYEKVTDFLMNSYLIGECIDHTCSISIIGAYVVVKSSR